jgi:hypothetical protein
MQLSIYNDLKQRISTLAALKYVALWNNQFEREDVNVPFGYPCCFIEFADTSYVDDLNLRQRGTLMINIHLGFESYKTEDTDILQLKQDLNELIHGWSTPNNTKFLRRSETQNFDHTNIQDYIISYQVTGLDVTSVNLPTVDATVSTLILNVDPIIDNNTIRTGVLADDVILSTEDGFEITTESGYELVIQQ